MKTLLTLERALQSAAPHQLLDTLRDLLARHWGADPVELLLADYGMTVLQPVSIPPYTGKPISAFTGELGRLFGSQETTVREVAPGRVEALVPVTVRGDRLGVLRVTLPAEACDVDELEVIAGVLGRELVMSERDTDLYLQARRTRRLTLAAELQWQLLPARACARPEYELGAQLEPAYNIHGDNFDWCAEADYLTLTVTNGMGEGIDAALLTNLAVNALRNARRGGTELAGQAALTDQAIYAHYQGRMHVSTLLLRFELSTGRVEVVDAGSPQAWLLRDGTVSLVPFDAQLPLGMVEETPYDVQYMDVVRGDRLLFVSDGIYDAASAEGEKYGERALARALTDTRLLPAAQVPAAVLRALEEWRGTPAPADDAMVVCLDWQGGTEEAE
ncbi:phosphatase [Streptomyces agglomeratus]|uniref:Phosphatase n=1 Tax=Streptomyces agglomeratus TaxID=285458 RepID=A0A1E5P1I5_9ACTN|nr:PP2C family protein-serine/threonine phosphatase [Streptomyces agglomeratus]OEJ23234.1 phosphatase [Streptomyces agglomeratus]OEJ42806.1 phosphatase [Streptomyces agglomeratus]OEJ55261.1 phosphatase [Streptomyces agglomeratus]OEJ62630.1 phosphatase [Streptomyces agglomeratus]